jgi:hypothetical protein
MVKKLRIRNRKRQESKETATNMYPVWASVKQLRFL